MRWPWAKRERRAASYTDLLIAGQESLALTGLSSSATTAAVEAAAGAWARTFGSAAVENAPDDVIEALSPLTLAQIGRDLIRKGESLLVISIGDDGELSLTPASGWAVSGATAEVSSWAYRVEDQGPSGRRTRNLPSAGVIHAVYSYDPSRPWQGRGPLSWASLSATLHNRATRALVEDVSAGVGYVLPAPAGGGENDGDDDPSDAQLGALLSRLKALKGGLMVVDSMSGSWGGDARDAPGQDWSQHRLGPEPHATLAAVHSQTARDIVGACGVPLSLVFGGTDAAALRESWRQFLHGSVAPVARQVERELRVKLDSPALKLNFDSLFASDLSGRARAFQSMVGAGMDISKAAALAGLMDNG